MIQVQGIAFEPDGMTITFIDLPNDIRVGGKVAIFRQIRLDADHPDYREDMDLLQTQAVRAVRSALEDFEDSEPHDPASEQDEEEDTGMGMGR